MEVVVSGNDWQLWKEYYVYKVHGWGIMHVRRLIRLSGRAWNVELTIASPLFTPAGQWRWESIRGGSGLVSYGIGRALETMEGRRRPLSEPNPAPPAITQ